VSGERSIPEGAESARARASGVVQAESLLEGGHASYPCQAPICALQYDETRKKLRPRKDSSRDILAGMPEAAA